MAQEEYLELKSKLISNLKELVEILETAGEEPLTGENRKVFIEKFNTVDRTLIGKFDQASYNYFEEKERENSN